MRRLLPLVLAIAALAAPSGAMAADAPLPPAHHVFVIVLENHEFYDTFGPGGQVFAPYFNRTLVPMGQLLIAVLRRRALQRRQLHRDGRRPAADAVGPGRLPR